MSRRAVLLVDHGSRASAANEMLEHVAGLVRELLGPSVPVLACHMELAGPTLGEAFDRAVAGGADEVVIHPYFLAPGRHSTKDIPALAEEAAARHPGVRWSVTPPLGLHRKLAEVVVERVNA
jgi:sirohydrochlorin ferrochelatase